MTGSESSGAIPSVRMAMLLPYLSTCDSAGVSAQRLLAGVGISATLVDHPTIAVPFESVEHLIELACRSTGTEHLGLWTSLARSIGDFGPFGQILNRSLTVHEYLLKGIAFYNMIMTGQRIWLSDHGVELRLNTETRSGYELMAYQSHLEGLVITTKKLREAQPDWSPREISLAYSTREELPDVEFFTGSQISRGTGETYMTIPKAMMGLRFPVRTHSPAGNSDAPDWRSLPENLGDLVQLQIDSLLSERLFQIDTIAESLGMSRRTLQRTLAVQGLSYSQLLAETRIRQAARWLEGSDMPIAEIAFALGYTEASNFTRAFRRQVGVSAQAFRYNADQA